MPDEILVAGAGPTGLTAAVLLADQGRSVRIIDKRGSPSPHSKAFGVNARTLAMHGVTGLTDRLLAAGRSTVRRSLNVDFVGSSFDEPWILYDVELETPRDPDEACSRSPYGTWGGDSLTGEPSDNFARFHSGDGAGSGADVRNPSPEPSPRQPDLYRFGEPERMSIMTSQSVDPGSTPPGVRCGSPGSPSSSRSRSRRRSAMSKQQPRTAPRGRRAG